MCSPARGGWGDPLERDPAAVLSDVRNELLSAAKAAADYGVVIDRATLDRRCGRDRAPPRRNPQARAAGREVPKVQRHDPQPLRRAAE